MIRKKLMAGRNSCFVPVPRPKAQTPDAEAIAAAALSVLSEDEARLGKFLNDTGLAVDSLRADHSVGVLTPALLHHVLHDEELLVLVAARLGCRPETVAEGASGTDHFEL